MIPWESCVLWLGYPIQNGVWPDISKHDNDGAITGAFWEGDSIEFDGIDDYVNCGNHNSLSLSNTITLEVLMRYSLPPSVICGVVAKDDATIGAGYGLYALITGIIRIHIRIGVYWKTVDDPSTSDDNLWHHFLMSYDGSHVRLYRDGTEVASTSASGNIATAIYDLRVGQYEGGSGFFNGEIKIVRLYNIALTAQQVRETYEQTYKLV